MTTYTIDFKGTKRYLEFYERIIKGMRFPSWCGENPNAIWDLLTRDIKIPATIYISGLDDLPKELQRQKVIILEVFAEAREWYKQFGAYMEIKIID